MILGPTQSLAQPWKSINNWVAVSWSLFTSSLLLLVGLWLLLGDAVDRSHAPDQRLAVDAYHTTIWK